MNRKEYTQEDFSWAQWTVEDIAQVAKELIRKKQTEYEKIKHIAVDERTFENTVYALEESNHALWKVHALHVLMNVSAKSEIREAAQLAVDTIEAALVDIEYDEGIYHALRDYTSRNDELQGADEKLLETMLREYRRMGFDLASEDREKVKINLKELSSLSSAFSKNINEYQDSIEVTREQLDGLSESYIANLAQSGDTYVVSLDYPELNPFLANATNAEKRKELAEKSLRKGGVQNIEILKKIIALREENAKLLGYENHAAYRLEVKMAKDSKTVFEFMGDIMERVREGVAREMNQLREMKQKMHPTEGEEIFFYDTAFYADKIKKEKYNVDTQKIQEYFPLQNVFAKMFEIYAELFSVRFEKVEGAMLWHEDAQLYKVLETDGALIAYFALDLYPREGKYGHAAVFEVITGHQTAFTSDEYVTPFAAMVTNFPKPNAEHPSLMTHYEVVTLFHEFGHVMHETLTTSKYRSQAGFNVSWDFAEAPSQMIENWIWNKEILKRISRHYKTHESLSDEMIENIVRGKNALAAISTMRQMVMAYFDMQLHTEGTVRDMNEDYSDMIAKHLGISLPKDQMFVAGWGHLMGYDAGYYGYMWAHVFAADMFTRFAKEGVMNAQTGTEYRRWILEKGSSQDELSLVEGFLGRPVSNEALLKELGLV